ncbi:hypothetical protein SDC9_54703 [bioreactor metagenome]|uniref:Uncharacterized protein n=1 Tax=bioreactor metagenome TaxID=1076179 RepID=A0A644WXP9_9ZZZZ
MLPSQRMRLLMGVWLLSAGVVSCADGKEKKEIKEEKKKDNTEEITCYAPMPPKDTAETKNSNVTKSQQFQRSDSKDSGKTTVTRITRNVNSSCYNTQIVHKSDSNEAGK